MKYIDGKWYYRGFTGNTPHEVYMKYQAWLGAKRYWRYYNKREQQTCGG